jgi:hypothetical protein
VRRNMKLPAARNATLKPARRAPTRPAHALHPRWRNEETEDAHARATALLGLRIWTLATSVWGIRRLLRGAPRWRPSRREETQTLKEYVADLKEELEDAEERLKEVEKSPER